MAGMPIEVRGDVHHDALQGHLPALCGPDAWHYAKGYVGGLPACESYLWHPTQGFAGMISSNVLPEPSSTPASSRKSAA